MDSFVAVRSAFATPFLLATLASAQQLKLNGPLARPIGGDVQDFFLTADDGHLLYRADQRTDDLFELFARPRAGVAPHRISDGGPVTFVHPALVAESRGRALYVGGGRLFSAALDGSGVVELSATLSSDLRIWYAQTLSGVDGLALTPDESRVVFLVRGPGLNQYEIHAAPIDGGPTVRLDLPGSNPRRFRLAPDGSAVVFSSAPARVELYRVPVTGGPIVKLTPDLLGADKVEDTFEIDPLSRHVVFRARLAGATSTELLSVPLDASAGVVRIAPGRTPFGGGISPWFQISPDGARVVALADQREVISAAIDGSTPALTLVPSMPSNRAVYRYALSPDSTTVLLLTDLLVDQEYAWLRVPIDGSASAAPLTGRANLGEVVLSPDGSRLLYVGEVPSGIHTVRIDGSTPPEMVATLDGAYYRVDFAPDGAHVIVHGASTPSSPIEVLSVPTTGGILQALNGPLPFGGNVAQLAGPGDRSVVVSSDGQHVLYLADERADEQFELFTAPVDGSTPSQRVTPTMPIGPVLGQVLEYEVARDGDFAVFRAAGELRSRTELYSVRLSSGASRLQLNVPLGDGGSVEQLDVSPDGQSVVYVIHWGKELVDRVYSVPVTGGASRLLAEGSSLTQLQVTPDGARVVYFTFGVSQLEHLWSVPLDGSAPPVVLDTGTLAPSSFQFAAGDRVVFSSSDDNYVARLFSVPVDGSAVPIELTAPIRVDGRRFTFRLNEARDTIAYVADHQVLDRVDLLSVPVDGSAPARVLVTPPGPFRGPNSLEIHGDAAFFIASLETPDHTGLFRVPLDGNTGPVRISGPALTGVSSFRISADGGRAVYLADESLAQHVELFSVPATGGTAVKLSGPRQRGEISANSFFEYEPGDVFVITPDSSRVLFRADLKGSGTIRLYSVPINGGSLPIVLDPYAGSGISAVLSGLHFAPDGSVLGRFVHMTDELPARTETFLFQADPTRPRSARLRSGFGTWISRQPGLAFSVLPGGDRIVYRHDQESDGVVELFLGFLPRAREHAGRR